MYGGQTAHGRDVPGMLAALACPMTDAGISGFVASAYHAELIVVPHGHLEAFALLITTGHEVLT